MGEDFNYMEAHKWFSNMDLLIDYINSNKYTVEVDQEDYPIRLVYSTPTCYRRASADQDYSINEADFFPYAYPDEHSYWTGYFTSRPSFKYLVRWATGVYRAATQILSEIGLQNDTQNIVFARYLYSDLKGRRTLFLEPPPVSRR